MYYYTSNNTKTNNGIRIIWVAKCIIWVAKCIIWVAKCIIWVAKCII